MIIWSAFLLGLLGSLHCVGMCGPIVLMLPGSQAGRTRFLRSRALYNVGRIVTYVFMGGVVGMLGQGVAWAGYQKVLGIVAGSLMILSVTVPERWIETAVRSLGLQQWLGKLQARLKSLLETGTDRSLFLVGVLNGFLPCGLVYSALAGSLAAGSAPGGMLFMALFGLGTAPALLATAMAGSIISAGLRRKITRVVPVGVVLLGLLFILRGLSLGIPFLSPDPDKMKSGHQHHSMVDRSTEPHLEAPPAGAATSIIPWLID